MEAAWCFRSVVNLLFQRTEGRAARIPGRRGLRPVRLPSVVTRPGNEIQSGELVAGCVLSVNKVIWYKGAQAASGVSVCLCVRVLGWLGVMGG